MFDQTDMTEVKKKLGSWAYFGGNVRGALLKAGTPQEIKAYVKRLIDTVAQVGGCILANGAVIDDATTENLHPLLILVWITACTANWLLPGK